MSKTTTKLLWLALPTANLLSAASESTDALGNAPWLPTLTILILTFGLAALIGFLVDSWLKAREAAKPGIDAYIDQIVAGNGTRVTRLTGRERY